MNCPKCGNPISPNMKFCAKCGTPVVNANVQQTANHVQSANQTPQPADIQSKKKEKKDKKGGKNIALKIVAIILVIAVLASGGLILADNIMYKNEKVEADEYITDFPVLKTKTEFMVYDAKKFPAESYRIKVERLKKTAGILKSEAFRSTENVFEETSSDKIYMIDFEENGEYRITLTDITVARTQPVTGTTAKNEETGKTIVLDVKVDNDDKEAVDKVTINSKPSDEPIKNFDDVDNTQTSTFIEATDTDLEKLTDMLDENFKFGFEGDFDFDSSVETMEYLFKAMHYSYGGFYDYFFSNDLEYEAESGDPLGKINYGYEKGTADNLKWICENIYNIDFDEDFIGKEGYVYGDNFYLSCFNAGGAPSSAYDVSSYKKVNNKYELIVDRNEEEWDTDNYHYIETVKVTAEIKIIDGERYWSIYKIEEYDPSDENPTTQSGDKPSSTAPSKDKDKPNSLTLNCEFETGEEKEITIFFPSSINPEEYHIHDNMSGHAEAFEDGTFEVEIYNEDDNGSAGTYFIYTSNDFTLENFGGCNMTYEDSSVEKSAYWDNTGKILAQHEFEWHNRKGKTTLCTGYYEEETVGSDSSVSSIYKKTNGTVISEDEYFEEYSKVMTYYANGHEIHGDL